MQTQHEVTDGEIQSAAKDLLNIVDARVHSHVKMLAPVRHTGPADYIDDEAGRWFVLFVKRSTESEWEAIGRRRTRAELLTMVQCGPASAGCIGDLARKRAA